MATSSSSSSSKTLTLEFPLPLSNDLMIQILSLLPVKSLLRFLSVSKSFNSLITSSHHRHLLPPPLSGLFSRFYTSFIPLSSTITIDSSLSFLPSLPPSNPLHTLHLSHGLLLLQDSSIENPLLLVANPATKRFFHIPSPPSPDPLALALSFSPTNHSPNHFKILSFPAENEFSDLWAGRRVEVYDAGSWKDIDFHSGGGGFGGIRLEKPRFAVWEEVVYVLDCEGRCYGIDVEGREWWEVNVEGLEVRPWSVGRHCIGVCVGVLCRGLLVDGELVVWGMEEGGRRMRRGFELKHRKRIWELVEGVVCGGGDGDEEELGVLGFHPDLEVVFLRCKGKLVWYNWLRVEIKVSVEIEMYRQWFVYSPCYLDNFDL